MNLPATSTISDVTAMAVIDEAERRIFDVLKGQPAPSLGGTPPLCPIKNHFTPGMYIREIFMPAGTVVTSRIHKCRHPFVVLKGRCAVYMGSKEGWQEVSAPHFGITEPGTRRLLFILEDSVWMTFHVTDKTNVDEIVEDITIPYENPLLADSPAYQQTKESSSDQ